LVVIQGISGDLQLFAKALNISKYKGFREIYNFLRKPETPVNTRLIRDLQLFAKA